MARRRWRTALRLIFASQDFGRPCVAPPGVPADRLKTLRRAFDAAVRDPKLKEDGARMKMRGGPSLRAAAFRPR